MTTTTETKETAEQALLRMAEGKGVGQSKAFDMLLYVKEYGLQRKGLREALEELREIFSDNLNSVEQLLQAIANDELEPA